jgi:hypothetical protein
MPRLVHCNPKYSKHRASGQAVVTLHGHDVYLGRHGTAASRREFDRVVAEWLANGRRSPYAKADDLSVVELIAAYWRHARDYYARPADADSNGEQSCVRLALAVVKRLYVDTPASTSARWPSRRCGTRWSSWGGRGPTSTVRSAASVGCFAGASRTSWSPRRSCTGSRRWQGCGGARRLRSRGPACGRYRTPRWTPSGRSCPARCGRWWSCSG